METKGFVEKAWDSGRKWKGQPIFKALVDGKEYDFFTQKEIMDYEGKELTFEATEGEYGLKGKIPGLERKQGGGGGGGRWSPEATLLEIIGKSVNTCIMESSAFARTWANPAAPKQVGEIQAIQDTMMDYMVAQAIKGIKEMQKELGGQHGK